MMASQKQSLPSFASILSVLSIVFYCAGFLRVELELNEQKKRINALENIEETTPSYVPNLNQLAKKTRGKSFLFWFTKSINIFYRKSIIQNVYFIFSITINLASPDNFAYGYLVLACSWRRGKEN